MKLKHSFLCLFFFVFTISTYAQKEEEAIQKVVNGYIENFFENNLSKMYTFLHPSLAKRGLDRKRGNPNLFFNDMSKEDLTKMLQRKKPLVKSDQKNEVQILDVFYNSASVKLKTGYPGRMEWIEYIHLVKLDGKWSIINIIWDYYPRKRKNKR